MIQFRVLREVIDKRQNDAAVEQQALTFAGVGHIGQLMGRDIELFGQNLPVPASLVEYR